VARDIISRPLADSVAYAREQRARWTLVVGGPGTAEGEADRVRVLELETGGERTIEVAELLADPARHFPGPEDCGHA